MNTITKLTILIALLIAYAFQAVPAHADAPLFSGKHTVHGSKVNSHVEVKPDQSCHSYSDNGWIVELSYYSDYNDYLSDFNHYFTQYEGTCEVAPEANNG
jgi:hypothetical protein